MTKHFLGSTEHKIVMVGLDNAGKTTILYQLLMNEVVHTSPTIGSNVEEVVWKNLHFIMWDLGGQESLRSAWNTYYTNTEVRGVVWLLSCATSSFITGMYAFCYIFATLTSVSFCDLFLCILFPPVLIFFIFDCLISTGSLLLPCFS